MQLLIYLIAYPILWCISKLPFFLLYFMSDVLYYIVYYVIRYRRTTVTKNLELVYPEKSKKEIKQIRKKFYHHLCDMFLEMIKSLTISRKELVKRYKMVNLDEFHAMERKGKSTIGFMGHYASYEWSNAIDLVSLNPCVGIYKQVKNKYFDKLARRIRGRFDSRLIASHKVLKQIIRDKQNGLICTYGMISDQSPKIGNAKFWTNFMGIKVPIFLGGEVIATKLNLTSIYMHVEKVKRGHYEVRAIPIADNSGEMDQYYVVKEYLKLLEKQIHSKPEFYLWTHKRWKHREATIPADAIVH
ncbi:lysophospholipid acyltransferase family protein [Aquimarina sp. W85]|uniref:lysophospholipid acyltransferase family protein n=1 Tax=Aquimarina rhodophyticola TaxID=3342246 RepID=UPI00366E6328